MSLTEEEKKRIEQEEYRKHINKDITSNNQEPESQKQIKKTSWWKPRGKGAWLLVISFAIFIALSAITTTDTSYEEKENVPKTTEKVTNEAIIPGLNAVDVYGSLKSKGFLCTEPETASDDLVYWDCREETSDHLYIVEILGESPYKILSVQATALNYSSKPTDDVVSDFLGYVASVPYSNSKQAEAKDWVLKNISKKTNTVINNVRFTLSSNAQSRILSIAHENSDLD